LSYLEFWALSYWDRCRCAELARKKEQDKCIKEKGHFSLEGSVRKL
jgi:hypothetical protein